MSSFLTKCFILLFSSHNTIPACIKLKTCFCHVYDLDGLEISKEFNITYALVGEKLSARLGQISSSILRHYAGFW